MAKSVRFTEDSAARISKVVRRVEGMPRDERGVTRRGPRIIYDDVIRAKITAKTAINGGIRWKYTIELGHWDMTTGTSTGGTWVKDSGSDVLYAYNEAEDMNTFTSGTGAIGTGNTVVTQSDGTVNGGSCKLVPLPVNGYVSVQLRGVDTGATPPQTYYTILAFANSAQ